MVSGLPLWQGILIANSNTLLYTSPTGGGQTQMTAVVVNNTSSSTITVMFYLCPSGSGGPATDTMILEITLSPGQTRRLYEMEKQWMGAGAQVYAIAGTSGVVTTFGSGYLVTS